MKQHSAFVILLIAAFAGVFRCSQLPMIAGNSSSETTNGFTISAVRGDGSPAVNASVRLRPAGYVSTLPALAKSAVNDTDGLTDANGSFRISGIDPGSYRIEVSLGDSAVLFACSLAVRDTFNLGTDTLRPFATVKGTVDTAGMSGARLYVQVPGLERLVQVDQLGAFTLSDLPAGLFTLRIVNADSPQTAVVRTDQVSAVAGAATTVTMQGWEYSKRIFLNTTASGAGVTGTVTDFPVLIRLTSANFTFSQAASDGRDIRFAKPDNTPLSYEIERWNGDAMAAEIWVRVDTLYGNNSSQFIVMLWGNPEARNVSQSTAVFDTGKGFAGVWHLGDNSNTPTVRDAVGRNSGIMKSGTVPVNTSSAAMNGIVGESVYFRGSELQHWIDLGENKSFINNKQAITISVWMNAESTPLLAPQLFSFTKGGALGQPNLDSRVSLLLLKDSVCLQARALDGSDYFSITSSTLITAQQWYHITGVVKVPQDSMYLYVNGTLWASSSVAFNAQTTANTNSTSGMIGADNYGLNDHFSGKIDEARIEDVARSADWIKLCHMNQNNEDKLVEFR